MRKFEITKLEDDWIGVTPISKGDPNTFRGFTRTEAKRLGLAQNISLRVGDILMLKIGQTGYVTKVKHPKAPKKARRRTLTHDDDQEDLGAFWRKDLE